jgi:hypothetical protein
LPSSFEEFAGRLGPLTVNGRIRNVVRKQKSFDGFTRHEAATANKKCAQLATTNADGDPSPHGCNMDFEQLGGFSQIHSVVQHLPHSISKMRNSL